MRNFSRGDPAWEGLGGLVHGQSLVRPRFWPREVPTPRSGCPGLFERVEEELVTLIEVHPEPFVQLIDDLGQWLQLRFLLTAPTLARRGLVRIAVGSSTLAGSLAGMPLNLLRASSKSFTRRTGERLRLRIYARTDFRTRDLPHAVTAINPWLRIQRWQRHRWWCGSSCRLPAPVA